MPERAEERVGSRWLRFYPNPVTATVELAQRARALGCQVEEIGTSSRGHPLFAFHLSSATGGTGVPRLLVTGQIHAAEFVAGFVARALVERLLGGGPEARLLLQQAVVCVVPLLNPDGALRVWRRWGWVGLAGSRVTANGVDPNRNFPYVPVPGRRGWNSSSERTWSPYYRGPQPLSEPECMALARLCLREGFCAALHFHSFGGVVFFPEPDTQECARIFDVFRTVFPAHQTWCRYRPVPEPWSTLAGQLDLFLLDAFGVPSATVEVSRPSKQLVWQPHRWLHFFSLANPPDPHRWAENDVPATIAALAALLERTGGRPLKPRHPELALQVPAG
jgi:hypothetical protein